MTGSEAWRILSSNLDELMRIRNTIYPVSGKPYTMEEITAQVIAFEALRKIDEG